MSAYPLISNNQFQKQKIKMAMALKGKNNHYHWYNTQRRHFIGAAKDANYSTEKAEIILDEMLNKTETVIDIVSAQLPDKFPAKIANSIFDGMVSMKNRLSGIS
jgi:serine/threonine-protein kinase HipA